MIDPSLPDFCRTDELIVSNFGKITDEQQLAGVLGSDAMPPGCWMALYLQVWKYANRPVTDRR